MDLNEIIPRMVYTIFIETTAEKAWEALTRSEFTRKYLFGMNVESDWNLGSKLLWSWEGCSPRYSGTLMKYDRPFVLAFLWRYEHPPGPESMITFKLVEAENELLRKTVVELTVTAEWLGVVESQERASRIILAMRTFWPVSMSGLKTLLETGRPLSLPALAGPFFENRIRGPEA